MIIRVIFLTMMLSTTISSLKLSKVLKNMNLMMSTTVYCPDPTYPKRNFLFPSPKSSLDPKAVDLPPYIYHIKCDKMYNSIEECINDETKLEKSYIKELLEFGAVYVGAPAVNNKKNSNGKHDEKIGKVYRYLSNNVRKKRIDIGTYCRVHVNPRRSTAVYDIDWNSVIHTPKIEDYTSTDKLIINNKTLTMNDLIIVDKPANVPHVPTVDNYIENVWYQVNKKLKKENDIYITSRLDSCTSGISPFAKNAESAALINRVIRDRKIKKVYKALINKPVRLGMITHCYRKVSKNHINGKPSLLRPFDPILISQENDNENTKENWIIAEMEIMSCTKLDRGEINFHEIKKHDSNADKQEYYELLINLITGRTHQIRLQLSALGSPIIGDTRYIPVQGLLDIENSKHGDGSKLMGPDPKRIGLQCSSICFPSSLFGISNDLKDISFEASKPWWKIKQNLQ